MYAIKAIYDGTNFKPMQPIPVKEDYEVVITFTEPLSRKQRDVMEFFNNWNGEELLDMKAIMDERQNFSLGRTQ